VVIPPDTFRCIPDEGMPFRGRPFQKGNMYLHFTVEFPDRVDPDTVCVRMYVRMYVYVWRLNTYDLYMYVRPQISEIRYALRGVRFKNVSLPTDDKEVKEKKQDDGDDEDNNDNDNNVKTHRVHDIETELRTRLKLGHRADDEEEEQQQQQQQQQQNMQCAQS